MAQKRSPLVATPRFHGLQITFGGILLLIVLGVIVGNGLTFQYSRSLLFRDVEQRGIWGARNLAHDAWLTFENQELQDLRARANALLLQADVVYVGIADREGALLISSGSPFTQQAGVLPELPNHSCQTTEPLVDSGMIFGKQVLVVSVPIVPMANVHDSDSAAIGAQCAGTLHLGMSLSLVDRRLFQMLVTLAVLCGYVIGLGGLAYSLAKRQFLRPLSKIIAVAQRMATGDFREPREANLSPDTGIAPHAEVLEDQAEVLATQIDVGVMARALPGFLSLARTRSVHLKNTGEQLRMAADENVIMVEESLRASQQHAVISSQAAASLETNTESFDVIAVDVARIASTAATILAAAHNIEHMIAQTLLAMQELFEQTNRNTERIGQLGETFSQIGSVVEMINTIADQTRMIAFNASIEAAGAGESGGRFSIVATEVRRLANTVVESLDEIQELVSSIQAATSELILSSETGTRKANQGMTLIGETGKTMCEMLDMLETTAGTSQHVAQATRQYRDTQQAIVEDLTETVNFSQNNHAIGAQALDLARRMQQLAAELEDALQTIRV